MVASVQQAVLVGCAAARKPACGQELWHPHRDSGAGAAGGRLAQDYARKERSEGVAAGKNNTLGHFKSAGRCKARLYTSV